MVVCSRVGSHGMQEVFRRGRNTYSIDGSNHVYIVECKIAAAILPAQHWQQQPPTCSDDTSIEHVLINSNHRSIFQEQQLVSTTVAYVRG